MNRVHGIHLSAGTPDLPSVISIIILKVGNPFWTTRWYSEVNKNVQGTRFLFASTQRINTGSLMTIWKGNKNDFTQTNT